MMIDRLAKHVGRRGFLLGLLGWVFLGWGLSMYDDDKPVVQVDGSRLLLHFIPAAGWAGIFFAGTCLCWLAVWWKTVEMGAFGFTASLFTMWGLGYALAVSGSQWPIATARGAVTNLVIAGFVLLASTWREN